MIAPRASVRPSSTSPVTPQAAINADRRAEKCACVPANGSRLADSKTGQEHEAVSRRDERREVLQPVGVGADHDRAEDLRAGRDEHDQQGPDAVLRLERDTRRESGSARSPPRAGAVRRRWRSGRWRGSRRSRRGPFPRRAAASRAWVGWRLLSPLASSGIRPLIDASWTSRLLDHMRLTTAGMIERPVFIVAPPRSGGTALFRSLARAPGVFHARDGSAVLDGIFELEPENRDWDSNRLTAADIEPRAVEDLRGRLKATLIDSSGNRPGIDASGLRWVDGQARHVLRVPFLAAVAPDAQFIYIHREPAADDHGDAPGLGAGDAGSPIRSCPTGRAPRGRSRWCRAGATSRGSRCPRS